MARLGSEKATFNEGFFIGYCEGVNSGFFTRCKQWNEERDNLDYNPALEARMLDEELKEWKDGVAMLDDIEQLDGIIDLGVVVNGTITKLCKKLGIDPYIAIDIVLRANEAKPKEKVNGKIVKGDKWVDPKEKLKELLQ